MERCPECGAEVEKNEEAVAASGKGARLFKMAVSVILVLALLCAMVLVVFKNELIPGYWFSSLPGAIPKDGDSNNVTCEGTYTASRFGLKRKSDAVVAKIGDQTLTNGQLLVFYGAVKNNYAPSYAGVAGMNLDASVPLDRQICGLDETLTWQQYFLQKALEQWQLYVLLGQKAEAAGFVLSEKEQKALDDQYNQLHKDYVEKGLYESVEALIEAVYGPCCSYEDYLHYITIESKASGYYKQMIAEQEKNVTEEDIEGFYEEQKEYLKKYDVEKGDGEYVVDVRHILITIEQVANKEEHIEESDWKMTEEEAKRVLELWLSGEATQESFATLAEQYSGDPGSNRNGGLYTGVKKGQMIEDFDKWCFDTTRKTGDYGIVKGNMGYHIMYFVAAEEYWHYVSAANAPTWRVNKLLEEQQKAMDLQVKYNKIGLWEAAYYAE